MQTDTADASNSKQKLQHWINKNQINKKTNRQVSINTFFRKIPVSTGWKEVRWRRDLKRTTSTGF